MEKDNTIRFKGEVYQLARRFSYYTYSGKRGELRHLAGGALSIYIDGKRVRWEKLIVKRSNDETERRGDEEFAIL